MKYEIIISVGLALVGYFFAYFYKLALTKRADRLAFITKQIHEFYGPLYLITKVGHKMFTSHFTKRFQEIDKDKNVDEGDYEWRIWVERVFMPLNRKGHDLVIDKAHLIREGKIPDCLLEYIAHVAGYEAIIKKWENKDFSESYSFFNYPAELGKYASSSYTELKKEQLKLLGKKVQD